MFGNARRVKPSAGGGLISGKLIVDLLHQFGMTGAIESYPKRYAAIATDLVTGREIWLQDGPIDQAVRASIALPGIFSPARIGDKWLVDGGLSNPVPVSLCRAIGADVIIAVNLNSDLLGRRFQSEPAPLAAPEPPTLPAEFISRLLAQLPRGLREQAAAIAPRLMQHEPPVWAISRCSRIRSTLCRTISPAPDWRASRRTLCLLRTT
jgi:NTE family protein